MKHVAVTTFLHGTGQKIFACSTKERGSPKYFAQGPPNLRPPLFSSRDSDIPVQLLYQTDSFWYNKTSLEYFEGKIKPHGP